MTDFESAPLPKRHGRPDALAAEALDQHLLEVATRLFMEQGYAGTSIEQIAAAAGAGKQTIYRRYRSKEPLFGAVIDRLCGSLVAEATAAEASASDPLTGLCEACRASLAFASRPDVIAIYRVIVAESHRFPFLIDGARARAIDPFNAAILRLLKAAQSAGQIRRDLDVQQLQRALHGLCNGWTMLESLIHGPGLTDAAEQTRFFDCAWSLFLRGATFT